MNLFKLKGKGSMKTIFILLSLLGLVGADAQNLYVVESPDIAQEGWYGFPDELGWGLNCTIQPVNFVASGQFLFCSIFTYNELGEPTWYTFSGEYLPNEDVFAWRESRGAMGSISTQLYRSSGGACPVCTYEQSEIAESDLGNVDIVWSDPLNATMTIGGVVKPIVHTYFHAGLQANNADFITEGAWYIQGAIDQFAYKGFVKFNKLELEDTADWINFEDSLIFDPNYEWYESIDNPLIQLNSRIEGLSVLSPDAFIRSTYGASSALLAFDRESGVIHFFTAVNGGETQAVGPCFLNSSHTASGLLRPAVGSNTRLYFSEGVLDNCQSSSLTLNEKRQVFISMTRIPQGGADMGNLPAFQNLEYF